MPAPIISIGDPCGIGPELLVCHLAERDTGEPATVVAHPELLEHVSRHLDARQNTDLRRALLDGMGTRWIPSPPPGDPPGLPRPGAWSSEWGAYAFNSLESAVNLALNDPERPLVTGPMHKRSFSEADLGLIGQTEYLAMRAGIPPHNVVMMLDCPGLRVVPLTRHIPLSNVAGLVRLETLEGSIGPVVEHLHGLGIAKPILALACVDPHCGEWGALNDLDLLLRARLEEIHGDSFRLEGPFSADTLFTPGRLKAIDVAFCWYHDQAMIPIKLLGFDSAVNLSLGLPFLRASPGHGPAYDLAWTGLASRGSFERAILLCDELASPSPSPSDNLHLQRTRPS
jgi:4-hydroxythreonine-4-phosphate dehydrogenase